MEKIDTGKKEGNMLKYKCRKPEFRIKIGTDIIFSKKRVFIQKKEVGACKK